MKVFIDSNLVKALRLDPEKIVKNLPSSLASMDQPFSLEWPVLLEFLNLGSLFKELPSFDPIFNALVVTLHSYDEKELVYHLYDTLFAEWLQQIKNQPYMESAFLLQAIKEKRKKIETLPIGQLFIPALQEYEAFFTEKPHIALHDLVLYLAWDRMCVTMARLFDYQSNEPKFLTSLSLFKSCLIESFLHITDQGKSQPSFYRLIEALFFYQMREENLQRHGEEEWRLFNRSFHVMTAQDEPVAILYVDHGLNAKAQQDQYLTLDSEAEVDIRLSLANVLVRELQLESRSHHFTEMKVISIK